VSESGYRVYFQQGGGGTIVLLCGGDKGSQSRDIAKAKRLARDRNESDG
jgi:putative addiction module killer protein